MPVFVRAQIRSTKQYETNNMSTSYITQAIGEIVLKELKKHTSQWNSYLLKPREASLPPFDTWVTLDVEGLAEVSPDLVWDGTCGDPEN